MDEIKKTLKDSALMRWTVLVLISGLMFATYWFYDFFSGLKGLMESELGISSEDFGLAISATTWANMFGMIIIGGMILDRWGIRLSGILFGVLCTCGGFLTAFGSSDLITQDPAAKLQLMIVGRLIFGVGIETICVVITRTAVKWFKGKELALAMGINVGFGRAGSALAIAFSIDIADGSVAPAVFFAASLIAVGLIMFLVYLIYDVRIDRQLQETAEEEEKFRLGDLLDLAKNSSFLWITLLCVTFYSAVFPFIQYAPDLLINKFGFTAELPDFSKLGFWESIGAIFSNGNKVASLIPLGTILFTPIFGSIVDKKGKAASLMIVGSLLLIFAHLSLSIFQNVYLGYAGLLSLGIAFSLVPAAMWPSVAKIIPENRLGTAYATMFTIQNWGLGLFFWLIGKTLDTANSDQLAAIKAGEANYDYTWPIFMLVFLGIISIALAFLLKAADRRQKFGLELPSGEKAV
jgi:MFS family permease